MPQFARIIWQNLHKFNPRTFLLVTLAAAARLKGLNDSHGHAAGDEFLLKVANAIRASVRETDGR